MHVWDLLAELILGVSRAESTNHGNWISIPIPLCICNSTRVSLLKNGQRCKPLQYTITQTTLTQSSCISIWTPKDYDASCLEYVKSFLQEQRVFICLLVFVFFKMKIPFWFSKTFYFHTVPTSSHKYYSNPKSRRK